MTKEVVSFLTSLHESLEEWANDAVKILGGGPRLGDKYDVAGATVDYRLFLRSANASVDHFRTTLKMYQDEMKDLEREHPDFMSQLTPRYLTTYTELTSKLNDALQKVRGSAKAYKEEIKTIKKTGVPYQKHFSERNEKALDLMGSLTLDGLIKILEDASLLGL